jgi:hypothetical protein
MQQAKLKEVLVKSTTLFAPNPGIESHESTKPDETDIRPTGSRPFRVFRVFVASVPVSGLAVSGLLLLGLLAALGITGNGKDPRAAGLMPEVVVVADSPRLVMDEIVVSAPNPSRLAVAAVRVSGIN